MSALRKVVSLRVYLLSFIEAAMTAACYTAAIYMLHPIDADTYMQYEGGVIRVGLIVLSFALTSYLFDFHVEPAARLRLLVALELSQFIGIMLLVQAVLAFINPDLVLQQTTILLGSGLMLVVLVLWRLFLRPAVWRTFGAQRVIFVGSGLSIDELNRAFRTEPVRGMEVAGFLLPAVVDGEAHVDGSVLGSIDNLMDVVLAAAPDRVIVDPDSIAEAAVMRSLLELRASGISIETASQAYEAAFGRIAARDLHPYTVVFHDELQAPPRRVAVQSIYTNILALVAAVILLPLMVVIAITLRILRKGPAFKMAYCTGLHGIPFRLYSFQCDAEGGWLSRFLFRYKLSRLPNALNLIRGEIALIGPRPEPFEFDLILTEMIPFYRQKHSVKPGVFGWSQLHCDSDPEEDTLRRLEYDLYYIKHLSVALDLYIALRGLKRMLATRSELSEA